VGRTHFNAKRGKKNHNIFAIFLACFLLPSDIPFLQNSIQLLLLSQRSDIFIFRMRQNFLLLPQQCHLALRSNTFAARKIGLLSSSSTFNSQGHRRHRNLVKFSNTGMREGLISRRFSQAELPFCPVGEKQLLIHL